MQSLKGKKKNRNSENLLNTNLSSKKDHFENREKNIVLIDLSKQ